MHIRPLRPSLKASLEAATSAYEAEIEQAAGYLEGRGIGPRTAARFRLGVVAVPLVGHEEYAGRLAIPSIGPAGDIRGLRFRALDDSEPKYLGIHGQETRLFNPRAVVEAGQFICITEGEIDAITLEMCGLPAVGVCGANAWKPHYHRIFSGFESVYVLGDPDSAGRGFAKTVTAMIEVATAVSMGASGDVNETYVKDGREGVLNLLREAGWSEQ